MQPYTRLTWWNRLEALASCYGLELTWTSQAHPSGYCFDSCAYGNSEPQLVRGESDVMSVEWTRLKEVSCSCLKRTSGSCFETKSRILKRY